MLTVDNEENKGPLAIYSDSSYVVLSLTDYLPIWKRRGFADASNKVLAHREILESIFTLAEKNPCAYAIVKVPAHKKENDELSIGNRAADTLTKEAAVNEQSESPSEPVSVNVVRKTDTQIPSFAEEQKKDHSLSASQVDLKSPFVCENGILCHDFNGLLCPVIPKHLQGEFTKYNHESLVHVGKQRLLEVLKEKFYWQNMEETVDKVIQLCLICAQVNPRPKGQIPSLQRIHPANGQWSTIQIDYIGPVPIGKNWFRFALKTWWAEKKKVS